LGGFSITDHDTPGDQSLYMDLAEKYDLVFVSGIEITAREGHLLAYCAPENAERLREFRPGASLGEYVEKCSHSDIILAPAHPFDHFRHGIGNQIYAHQWSALETFNGSTVFPFSNRRAECVARELDLPVIGGSDAHTPHYIGFVYTEAHASTAQQLLQKIANRETTVGGNHLTIFQFARRMLEIKILK
jgi:predicted metal-dependent phosphoesterase TrpH